MPFAVHGPNACAKRMEALHEPESGSVDFQRLAQLEFMVPMRPRKRMGASHEPQRAAGILPAEEAWLCRRHVGSTLLRHMFSLRRFMAGEQVRKEQGTLHEPSDWSADAHIRDAIARVRGIRGCGHPAPIRFGFMASMRVHSS